MSEFIVYGEKKLHGDVRVSGSKNSVLPILAASLLAKNGSTLHNVPILTDVTASLNILNHLGCKTSIIEDVLHIDSGEITEVDIPRDLMHKMRSSIIFLGAIIARCGKAKLSYPGGCELGARPINLHLEGLRKLGVIIDEDEDCLRCYTNGKLKGADIVLSFPSVGATQNMILAASTASGTTKIMGAAKEPEVVDLVNYLICCGAKIMGAGTDTIIIEGVDSLGGCEYKIMPDRIEAATFIGATAIATGKVTLRGICEKSLRSVLPIYHKMGCKFEISNDCIEVTRTGKLLGCGLVKTMPYPGFPTDAQAIMMAASVYADEPSVFFESIFESRFGHVPELCKMGADITVDEKTAYVKGGKSLFGRNLKAMDLRGGAALTIAALGAVGESRISALHHVDRGYENFCDKLAGIGAEIKRIP